MENRRPGTLESEVEHHHVSLCELGNGLLFSFAGLLLTPSGFQTNFSRSCYFKDN